mgnify:CR=1 FL=1
MQVQEIVSLLGATVLAGADKMDMEVRSACGSDMMSDVLAYVKDQAVLLTGLLNPQVVRTAEMMDVVCIVFVRGKQPTPAMVELAEKYGKIMLSTGASLFTACGLLYEHGLRGGAACE